jgi:hypothetical protein
VTVGNRDDDFGAAALDRRRPTSLALRRAQDDGNIFLDCVLAADER